MSALSDHIERLKTERSWLDETLPTASAAEYRHLSRLLKQNEREYTELASIVELFPGDTIKHRFEYERWQEKQVRNGR